MKKLIFCTLLVSAFTFNLSASNGLTPNFKKGKKQEKKVARYCENMSYYWCVDGVKYYNSGQHCTNDGGTQADLYTAIDNLMATCDKKRRP